MAGRVRPYLVSDTTVNVYQATTELTANSVSRLHKMRALVKARLFTSVDRGDYVFRPFGFSKRLFVSLSFRKS